MAKRAVYFLVDLRPFILINTFAAGFLSEVSLYSAAVRILYVWQFFPPLFFVHVSRHRMNLVTALNI